MKIKTNQIDFEGTKEEFKEYSEEITAYITDINDFISNMTNLQIMLAITWALLLSNAFIVLLY